MYKKFFLLFALLGIFILSYLTGGNYVANKVYSYTDVNSAQILSSKSISLEKRYDNKFVNDVFKDNILLTLNYMAGRVKTKSDIIWEDIEKPRNYKFDLKPGESFAFHNQILDAYNKNVVKTTNARFNFEDGFKSSGYLFGDGVCHLASILYWAAVDAGLSAHSPNHNFANINEVPKEYGVSIYFLPGGFEKSARENLYITNSFDTPVSFSFSYDGKLLSVNIVKVKS